MNELSAQRIVIELVSFQGVLDGKNVIGMKTDAGDYLQLAIKRGPLSHRMVEQLEGEFQVKAITGMAFDYFLSLEQSRLVLYPDTTVVGVWVKVSDFAKVHLLFGK